MLRTCWAGDRLAYRSQLPQIPECRHARQAEVETAFAPRPPSVAYVLSLPGKDRDRAFQIRKQCKRISQSDVLTRTTRSRCKLEGCLDVGVARGVFLASVPQ